MKDSFRTQDGRKLTYRREGSGPLLVCHPGGPGFSSRYLADLGGLGTTRTLVMLDPRGTGGSDAPEDTRAYTTSDYVADVEELREHLGVEQLDLLGHSHGGVVALGVRRRASEARAQADRRRLARPPASRGAGAADGAA